MGRGKLASWFLVPHVMLVAVIATTFANFIKIEQPAISKIALREQQRVDLSNGTHVVYLHNNQQLILALHKQPADQ